MHHLKRLTLLLFLFAIILSLSACGESLKKPTGLETNDSEIETTENELPHSTGKHEEDQSINDAKNKEKVNDVEDDEKSNSKQDNQSAITGSDKKSDSSQKKLKKNTQKEKSLNDDSNKRSSKQESDTSKQDKANSPDQSKEVPKKDNSTKDPEEDPKDGPEEKPKEQDPKQKSTITHSIVISPDEVPLSPTKQEIDEENTALQALIAITKEKGIQMDYRGGQGASAYVEGIGNVYEFDRGPGSGWMFRVNGIFPNRGVGVTPICDGDVVEWLYTTNLGEDLGADLEPFRRDGKCP